MSFGLSTHDSRVNIQRENTGKKRKRKRRARPILLLIFVLVIGALLLDSNLRLVKTEYELFFPNLPESFDGFRIVILADVHAAVFGEDNERLISMVEDARPDIIAIGGISLTIMDAWVVKHNWRWQKIF